MLVIFDLDGTLLNTIRDLSAAANHALAANGYPVRSEAECLQFVGNGISKLLERALPDGAKTAQHVEKIRPAFLSYYNEHLADFTTPYDGIVPLLHGLQKRNIQLAVASNKYHAATCRLLQHFFPSVSFAAVLGQREGHPTKPNPQIVEEILSLCNKTKETCLYVGDSDVDMQTAKNAGVKVCGVTWGFKTREILSAYQPDFLIDCPQELVSVIERF